MQMAAKTKRPSVKQQVRDLLDSLPDTCTVEDVQYQLYLIDKINRGEERLAKEGGISHDEIRKRFAICRTA
jgi:hypothetical protein